MTTNIERTVDVMQEQWETYDREDQSMDPEWDREMAKRLAAADPPLLVTDEIQAVIDAAIRVRRCRNKSALEVYAAFKVLDEAVDALEASKETSDGS